MRGEDGAICEEVTEKGVRAKHCEEGPGLRIGISGVVLKGYSTGKIFLGKGTSQYKGPQGRMSLVYSEN